VEVVVVSRSPWSPPPPSRCGGGGQWWPYLGGLGVPRRWWSYWWRSPSRCGHVCLQCLLQLCLLQCPPLVASCGHI